MIVMFLAVLLTLIYPQNTFAGVFSFVNNLMGGGDASVSSAAETVQSRANNSQTMVLLQAALNTDPNPTKSNDISIVDDSALETALGPSGTAKEVEDKIGTDKVSVYVVHEGDSLSSIAKMFDVTPNTILWANDLKSSKDLKKGQELIILPISGVKYTIKKGDTMKSIAAKFHGSVDEIIQFNNLSDNPTLIIGDEIIIPDGEVVSSSPSSSKPSIQGSTNSSAKGYFIKPTKGIKTQGLHGKYRTAIDLAGPVGTSVYAAASGKVIVAKTGGYNGGYGNYIVIQHSNGMQSLYGHLSEVDVSSGTMVSQGDFIGKMGNSGHSTGPHLHFEILGARNWNPFN